MSSHVITPGPYRATKLWNEVTRLFRAGMPLRKHRHNFRHHSSCFTAAAAVDWLHELLRNNSNFGPDVTRQQTLQLLKKFLKNHVIEDVKGRWGSEDLEDNGALYRFPSTSPLKPIPCPAPGPASSSIKKRHSLRDRDGFFRFRSVKKQDKETLENVDPAHPGQPEREDRAADEQRTQRRELTVEDEQDIWRDITLTHLQRTLGVSSLSEFLDPRYVNPQNIIHNMTKVNKHGVVTLDDKTNDLPHWVLSAMKSLASWPKYDSAQPSYPGFERDVFKTVSDYFYSLPQPLLTYELYELFINVLVFSGHVAPLPASHRLRKRKQADPPSVPPPAAKTASFRSTECLLLSLLRQKTCDEAESPMRDVIGGQLRARRLTAGGRLGGSCLSLSAAAAAVAHRPPARSCSLETILDDSPSLTRQQLFLSSDSLAASAATTPDSTAAARDDGLPAASAVGPTGARRSRPPRPRSVGSCLDIVLETREDEAAAAAEVKWQSRAASCLDVNAPASQPRPPSASCTPAFAFTPAETKARRSAAVGPRPASSTSDLWTLPPPAVVRRCLSSLDVSKPPRPVSLLRAPPTGRSLPPPPKPEHSVLRPQCERVAVEALQLCTLLLPPASRRKLQLLMRMMSRISQNVDMPRLHPAIGTRTLMVHSFSGCVLGSAEEGDLDELLATRLVSFLMDHQQSILSVPAYLHAAISDHIRYLRTVQVPVDSGSHPPVRDEDEEDGAACVPMPVYAFCRQISGAEFEQQKLEASQKALEELLDILLTDQNLSEKDRHKKLKQFQKQYPDIYRRRVPSADSKPKIKPPLLNIKRSKVFSIRN